MKRSARRAGTVVFAALLLGSCKVPAHDGYTVRTANAPVDQAPKGFHFEPAGNCDTDQLTGFDGKQYVEYRCDWVLRRNAGEPAAAAPEGQASDEMPAGGSTPAAVSPAPPPTAGGCARDADCKGARRCQQGRCVDAPTAPEPVVGGCGRDTDCKGERICVDHRCVDP